MVHHILTHIPRTFYLITSEDFKCEAIAADLSGLEIGKIAPAGELHMLHIPSDSSEEDADCMAYLNRHRDQSCGGRRIVEVWCGGSVYVLCLMESAIEHHRTELSVGSRIFPVDGESVIDEVDLEDTDGNEVLMLRAADVAVEVSESVTNTASQFFKLRCCGKTKKGSPCKNLVRKALMCRWHIGSGK
jgi:hypothetical protein